LLLSAVLRRRAAVLLLLSARRCRSIPATQHEIRRTPLMWPVDGTDRHTDGHRTVSWTSAGSVNKEGRGVISSCRQHQRLSVQTPHLLLLLLNAECDGTDDDRNVVTSRDE